LKKYPVSGRIFEISGRIPDSSIISLSGPDIRPDMISGAPLMGYCMDEEEGKIGRYMAMV
jgi:hypothetical protein